MRKFDLEPPSSSVSERIPPVVSQLLNWLPGLASMALFVLIGLELARVFWLAMPAGPAWQPAPPSTLGTNTQAQQSFNIQPLLAANLYGEFKAEEQLAAELNPVDAPDTNLRLTLRGIVATEDSRDARALIESSPNELLPYAVGMAVPGGAKLHAVYADRVLLERGGRLETLRLEKDKPTDPSAVVARATPLPSGSSAQVLDAQTAVKLSEIRSELLNDPTKASRYLRVQPARRDGGLVGYRIYPGRNRELFREVGLRPGDIVTRVNGVDLNDPGRSLQLLGELSQAANIDLTIERAGNLQSFSVSLN